MCKWLCIHSASDAGKIHYLLELRELSDLIAFKKKKVVFFEIEQIGKIHQPSLLPCL